MISKNEADGLSFDFELRNLELKLSSCPASIFISFLEEQDIIPWDTHIFKVHVLPC